MNRSQLVQAVSESTNSSRRTVSDVVDGVFDTIIAEVQSGRKVTVVGFGSFTPSARGPRVGRNPRTGAVVPIPASKGVRFATGSAFKSALNPKEGVSMAVKKAAAKRSTRKRPAKKTAARKSAAKRTAKKRAPARKSAAKKTTAKRAAKRRAPAKRTVKKRPASAPRSGPSRSGPPRSGPRRSGHLRSGPPRSGPRRSGHLRSGPSRGGPRRSGTCEEGGGPEDDGAEASPDRPQERRNSTRSGGFARRRVPTGALRGPCCASGLGFRSGPGRLRAGSGQGRRRWNASPEVMPTSEPWLAS